MLFGQMLLYQEYILEHTAGMVLLSFSIPAHAQLLSHILTSLLLDEAHNQTYYNGIH